jgi:GR25 family glycosyltransferase involved in LPS biosynthesis
MKAISIIIILLIMLIFINIYNLQIEKYSDNIDDLNFSDTRKQEENDDLHHSEGEYKLLSEHHNKLLVEGEYKLMTEEQYNIIPKNKIPLWSYWQVKPNSVMPPYIKVCFDTFKKHCEENYEIIILNEKTVYKYLPNLRTDLDQLPSLAHKTDYIRVALLYHYGGLWLDADTIVINDLQEIINKLKEGYDFIGFGCSYIDCPDNGYPLPSNGAMASQKHSILMKNSLIELDDILDRNKSDLKKFDYFELGKDVIYKNIKILLKHKYAYFHFPVTVDGSRDKDGKWIGTEKHLSKHKSEFKDEKKLMFIFLENNKLDGNNTKYNWFGKKDEEFVKNCDYWICDLFRKSIKYTITFKTPVFYINLNDNIDRKNNVIKIINLVGFTNYTRIPAINTKLIEYIYKYKNKIESESYTTLINNNIQKKRHYHEELTNGSIGCFLSHLKVYQKIVDNKLPCAIILEDDISNKLSKEDFWKIINSINIPNDTDIMIFNCFFYGLKNLPNNNTVGTVDRFYCLHFYFVTLEGAKKLVQHLSKIIYQIDSQISYLNKKKLINLYVVKDKNLFFQGRFQTTMQNLPCEDCNKKKF